MDSSSIINTLEANGWTCVRTKGDHRYYRKKERSAETDVCPTSCQGYSDRNAKSIERQTGIKFK